MSIEATNLRSGRQLGLEIPGLPRVPLLADNRLQDEDRPIHEWYRFVLSFPPHLVREYVRRFDLDPGQRVLDPFCGTGTTLVECKKLGLESAGVEANPMARFASSVKVDWSPDPDLLVAHAEAVAETAISRLRRQGISDDVFEGQPDLDGLTLESLPPESESLLLEGSISPLPLHKVLLLLDCLASDRVEALRSHELLALAQTAVSSASNLHFGPEVGVETPKSDAQVIGPWLRAVRQMAHDLRLARGNSSNSSWVHQGDARQVETILAPQSIDAVITSPPYPNEKDYTRSTRLESVLLGFIRNKSELQALKRGLIRSNTRTVYKGDDDDRWVAGQPEVARIAGEIERRRIELGKTSGFERMYPRVTKLYFGGMARHLAGLRNVLRPGARLAYVVGDQASFLRVLIRTGQLLADIADSLGYEVESIDLFRTRMATATRQQMREEVVVLRWPGRLA